MTWNGYVSLCRWQWQKEPVFGDLSRQDVKAILDDVEFRRTRRELREGVFRQELCRRCGLGFLPDLGKCDGEIKDLPPIGADAFEKCEPIYEEVAGWSESTVGVKSYDNLPANAKAYLKRLEEVVGVPVDIISTGPERDETIILRNPYA